MNTNEEVLPAEELVRRVAEWGREKGINNATMQFAKINEEVGELAHELVRGYCGSDNSVPSQETVDAIGDILVTVIIFADIIGVDTIGALRLSYDTIRNRVGHTVNGSFIKDGEPKIN